MVTMRYGGGTAGSAKKVLLWENPSPSSAFAAQTVSVDASGFDFIGIELLFSKNSTSIFPLSLFPATVTDFFIPISAPAANRTGGRAGSYSFANKQITFSAANYNATENNDYAIPAYIWGIKL